MRPVFLAGILALAAWVLGWWIAAGGARDAVGADYAPDLARGEAIYAEACASCHGADLEGAPDWRSAGPGGRLPAPPHDASGHTWHHPDRILLDITTRGSAAVVGGGYDSDMPGFGDAYSAGEIRDVLEWIKTQWPEREQAFQARVTAEDEAAR